MIDLALVIALIAAIVVAVHYRAQAQATKESAGASLAGIATSLSSEFELLGGDVRAKIDAKFAALAQWLIAELQKQLAPPVPDPAAPVAPVAVPPPAAAPNAPSDAEPSAAGGGTDLANAKIAEIDAATKALQEHRAKLVAARDELQALL